MAEAPLRILLLEDSPEDAELIRRELRRSVPGAEVRRVEERHEFDAALTEFEPHVILSDHRLARFTGMDALATVREQAPDVPFIFVTGAMSEETAVESIKAGAWDYVLKDRLVRLGSAITAALELQRTRDALRRSQEQLLHAQKMEALGRLAGGVAHDFNNLTTAILGFTDFVLSSLEPADERRRDLEEIRAAADRASSLSRQLLAFSRKQMIDLQPLQMNAVVEKLERLLRRLIGEDITLEISLAPDAGWVRADAGQLEQVIVNLAVNARDAMPSGGTLAIDTSSVMLDDAYVAAHPEATPGRHIRVTVRDTGTGMDQATMERLFEPFFTTKGRGQGTGLGLSTVYGIVRQFGGHLLVQSEPGEGSEFQIYFPEVPAPAGGAEVARGREIGAPRGTETVLLVEDDDMVRRVAQRVLQRQGYQVLEARSGAEALALASERQPGSIDLLLTDIVMPGMSGPEVQQRIHASHPGLRTIFMSGYTGDAPMLQAARESDAVYLQKPFTVEEIARTVREVLDRVE